MHRGKAVVVGILLLIVGAGLWSFNAQMLPLGQAEEANEVRVAVTSLIALILLLGVCSWLVQMLRIQLTKQVMRRYRPNERGISNEENDEFLH